MEKIDLLNIPNYFSSYYLYGLNEVAKVRYCPNTEFRKWNGTPLLILRVDKKIIIIDNRDPNGVQKDLYSVATSYFATNKLKDNPNYNLLKLKALFPHYPINFSLGYLKIFRKHLFKELGKEKVMKDFYAQVKRPNYQNYSVNPENFSNYIFFSGSIWKKEEVANKQRAVFIKACKENEQIDFEGGLIPRTDGDNRNLEDVLGPKRYTSKNFHKKSSSSLINFNNPAVLGAISWRVGEFFNLSSFVLSLPFMVDLPVYPLHGKEIHMIKSVDEIEDFLNYLLKNPHYHRQIKIGGKNFFNKFCDPKIQALRILKYPKYEADSREI
ncbi:hypothetical protein LB465_16310 [Salegentibacter sp. LM13S]|uniref:hypothetical protein n=1 Tax=Salegentibacter lacus TaxID=2873599 RepID=UPI001CC943E9|nr:hypothetical protein [Salegentibacter lacus]MBZ9632346.1 hypothetical protein [Salegentibacter lacus]